jgi:hypothetical protein
VAIAVPVCVPTCGIAPVADRPAAAVLGALVLVLGAAGVPAWSALSGAAASPPQATDVPSESNNSATSDLVPFLNM